MKLALSLLCENPARRTGLSTLFHEFVAHALVVRPDVSWVLFAGPNQPWEVDDPRVEVVRRFPANDRPYARLVADHLRVGPEARRRGAHALLTVGFMPVRDAGLPVAMHVFSVHHLRAGGGVGMWYRRWAMREGIRRARLVIANSQWTAGQLAAAYGGGVAAPAGESGTGLPRTIVSYEGVQHDRFRPDGPRGREDLPPEYLFWSSNFYRYKRAELALAAYAALPLATRARFPLVMAGGDWHGGRRRAEAAARRLGVSEQVRFLGWVSDAELPALYRGARAHLLSTAEETFGRSVAEAMASGCPCVLQDLPVLREVAAGAAVLADFRRPEAAAAEIERVCTDEALVGRLRQAGLMRAAGFSFDKLTQERLEAIERAVNAPFTVPGSQLARNAASSGQADEDDAGRSASGGWDERRGPAAPLGRAGAPRWVAAGVCALAGAAVFQWFGNANHGYIDTNSLFWWWGWQWWNPASETQQGWLVLALSAWLLARNLKTAEFEGRRAEGDKPHEGGAGGSAGSDTSSIRHRPSAVQGPQFAMAAPVAALLGGLVLHAIGFAAQQARVSIVALLVFAWGVLRLGGGRRWGWAAAFPLAFLVFAIPVNVLDSVGFWLRLWVIHASTAIAHAVGIGVIENGTQLIAPDGRYRYDVAAACSGVRSLMALAALSLLIGYLNFRSWWRRALLLLLCFPLVYVGNLARITAIIGAAQAGGPRWGDIAHAVMGWGIFVIVLGGVLGAAAIVRRWAPEGSPKTAGGGRRAEDGGQRAEDGVGCGAGSPDPAGSSAVHADRAGSGDAALHQCSNAAGSGDPALHQSANPAGSGLPTVGLAEAGDPALPQTRLTAYAAAIVVLVAAAEIGFLHRLATRPERGRTGVALAADGHDPVELPAFLGHGWVGLPAAVTAVEREILPPDTGYSRMQYVLAGRPQRVFLSIVLSGRDRTSIHRPELCLLGQGWTITGRQTHRFAGPGGATFPATVLRVLHQDPGQRGAAAVPSLVAYWFVGDDRVVATPWQRLACDAWYRIVHGRADRWAYVLLQTDAADGDAAALARMQQVLDGTLPAFEPSRLDHR